MTILLREIFDDYRNVKLKFVTYLEFQFEKSWGQNYDL